MPIATPESRRGRKTATIKDASNVTTPDSAEYLIELP
jgi:hypothetical protein